MSDALAGRSAIVTGASRGLGLAAAALHDAGANIVPTSRTEEACIARTVELFGRVDILVNNAGANPAFGRCCRRTAGASRRRSTSTSRP